MKEVATEEKKQGVTAKKMKKIFLSNFGCDFSHGTNWSFSKKVFGASSTEKCGEFYFLEI